jgi:hypothetical protein
MPSPLEDVLSMFVARSDEPAEPDTWHVTTFRLPKSQLSWVDALSAQAEVSRSAMLVELVRVGLSELLGALPDEVRAEVEQTRRDIEEGV